MQAVRKNRTNISYSGEITEKLIELLKSNGVSSKNKRIQVVRKKTNNIASKKELS